MQRRCGLRWHDLVFCNGAEICLDTYCETGSAPCVDLAHCDEVGAVCLECVSDAECDDSLFCAGVETCVESSCTAGALPCVDLAHCDEPARLLPCTDPDDGQSLCHGSAGRLQRWHHGLSGRNAALRARSEPRAGRCDLRRRGRGSYGCDRRGLHPEPTACGIGACARPACSSASPEASSTAACPASGGDDATCDGVDDDCDGVVDEDFGPSSTSCGLGACAAVGELQCVAGTPVDSCIPGTPGVEVCDQVDDDCDGALTDGGLSPEGEVCNPAAGACEAESCPGWT